MYLINLISCVSGITFHVIMWISINFFVIDVENNIWLKVVLTVAHSQEKEVLHVI